MKKKIASIHLTNVLSVNVGRLVVKGQTWSLGTVTAHRLNNRNETVCSYYADFQDYKDGDNQNIKAAIFPSLPTGNYRVCKPGFMRIGHRVTVYPADVREVELT